jgi:hypothetical protein
VRSLLLCALLSASSAWATSITNTNSFIFTPSGGYRTCVNPVECAIADPNGYAIANAAASSRPGYVAASLSGGSTVYGSYASAYATATSAESYLLTGGSGSGVLRYTVALTGASTGNPADPAVVLFNGASYFAPASGAPALYSFTQAFFYGEPFLLTLSIEVRGSWNGSASESGSKFAIAELKGIEVVDLLPASAIAPAPEPSTAMMWIGGVLLILAGSRFGRKQR